ncbi:MAG: histidinol-phosphate transaminase [Lentisphaeraceae bacterium]|nr:histidinol-phosphate transaminase [Lentisphaeraceae bacterium]
MTYFRKNIEAMQGYAPGEQPQAARIIKLNTNENPYPPSPKAVEALRTFDTDRLRKYPEPVSRPVIDAAVEVFGCTVDEVLVGNGSDDILTILIRSFAGEDDTIGWLNPSYSLYPVLTEIQNAGHCNVSLNEDFSLPDDIAEQAKECSLFFLTYPNAPTANTFCKERIRQFCRDFNGVVVIDEAYGDFANENCMEIYKEFDNVVVTRSFSKSYSLAGLRVGLAFGNSTLIGGMKKVKDSYNVNALSQAMAAAALRDQDYFKETVGKIKATRSRTSDKLRELGFNVLNSETNFIFAVPPIDAADYFEALKQEHVYIRYFKGERTGKYVRITVGTDQEMDEFLEVTKKILS